MSKVKAGDSIRITAESTHWMDEWMLGKLVGKVFTVTEVDEDGDPWFNSDITDPAPKIQGEVCVDRANGMKFEIVQS